MPIKTLKSIPTLLIFLLLTVAASPVAAATDDPALYGRWLSITPPLLAIVFALVFKRVIPALFLGLWLGAWLVHDGSPVGLWSGLLDTFEVYVKTALADSDHAAVILFSLMIGGMVGIISRNGGMQGIVNHIVRWADSARHSCMTAATMGLAIFFDDYANTLVVGNAMRPVTDAMRVSREKLAYIVDSTAAPIACIALITTWVGYEVGLIDSAIGSIPGLDGQGYFVYLATIPYSFYPILSLAFVFMVAWSGRDFGPMLKAERAARAGEIHEGGPTRKHDTDGQSILPVKDKPQRAINALLPIGVLIVAVMVGLYVTGSRAVEGPDAGLRDIIGSADAYRALMWASLLGVLTAAALSMSQRILDLEQIVDAWYRGLRAMLKAIIILILAWSLGQVTDVLGTASFLVSVLGDTLPAWIIPTLVFLIAAGTGFGTGSSWGAMAILIPLTIPLTWAVMQSQGMAGPEHMHILYSAIASVLAGSVWGDHCSPISDTTILSSLSSGCDHVEHVRTQLPYAMLVGAVSILAGSLPVALGMPWWAGLGLGLVLLAAILRLLGRDPDA
ncbi:Na+/H+ antiporter NhaC family protein [Marinihelvus fidelis]|uniref:Na+/H+ antiporter NhaC family protein n=1 Tax=Marinihelvus fidelis TaxID=2613842 RepID=A0A5N0TF81_9GAMM|nr:Na+/H+ antiporter NhaC family protein [Marinihelvus fidelis]KAA9133188.1 Na+/H+ antiporter NhaC family protein [Marinihelvus fidelis]